MIANLRPSRGFTLIEVMIVVAIVAILASIALPSYLESVKRGRRADAKTALLENAQWLEKQYSVSFNYGKDAAGNDITSARLPVQTVPRTAAAFYNVAFAATPTAETFTLQAVPTGSMANDRCGTLTLDNAGRRGQGNTGTEALCWDK